jgi:hypothetical protein
MFHSADAQAASHYLKRSQMGSIDRFSQSWGLCYPLFRHPLIVDRRFIHVIQELGGIEVSSVDRYQG